ncbi:phage tail-collar fiber domain-containing protein [Pseudomonas granadensis]|uniref:phage tail-collar fiber domain-containing protein n=1 Tax=Pseudomonas granadensis TaxID=1421430 RepID=UPI00087D44F7|nr:phage tail protein [Pseudomonas granadensis]SDS46683.1 Phage-related tail fibre protein [Pseudomonas granadensis]
MADYYTLLTNAGTAYETACKAVGVPIKLTQISVGDGNGAVYNPAATATALKREVWRGPLNALFQDEKNPSWLLAEVTIPPDVGGWYVREAGLWTDTGILYAVVKYPESFKPVLATSGSGKEFYIRSIFETSNASLVTLQIDDTVVKATRAWVMSYLAEELGKLDGKQSVRVAATGNVVLNGAQQIDGVAVIAGDRVLLSSQTPAKDNGLWIVANGEWQRTADADSTAKVTPGLTVMVEEGLANGDSLWHMTSNGPITLGTTALTFKMLAGRTGIAAGTYKSLTVDEYGRATAGANPETLAGFGIKDSYTKAEVEALIAKASALPVGSIVAFPVDAPPPGFLELDNSVKSSATYPDLSAYLGGKFNKGDEGVGNFRLPESRGEFLRGWDHGRGVDAGREMGSFQKATLLATDAVTPALTALQDTTVGFKLGPTLTENSHSYVGGDVVNKAMYPDTGISVSTAERAGLSFLDSLPIYDRGNLVGTRPRNLAVMWCIKAWNAPVNQGNVDITALATLAQHASETNQGTAKVATQVQTDAGSDDRTIVTPKKMRWGFSISVSGDMSGSYVIFPSWLGGLILQWGMTLAIPSGGNYVQVFPLAFPMVNPSVFTTYPNTATDAPVGSTYIGQIKGISKANVTIRNTGQATGQFYYFAIGR